MQDHIGLRLKRVYLYRTDIVEVVENVYIGIPMRILIGLLEVIPALWIVRCHRSNQGQLKLGDLFCDSSVGINYSQRVFPRVEARDLTDHRPIDVDAKLIADIGGVLRSEGHILR